jgi:hypothetical protein
VTIRPAETAQELLDELVAQRGGDEAFDAVDMEVGIAVVKLLSQLRAAAPDAVPRLATAVGRLMAQLPPRRAPAALDAREYLARAAADGDAAGGGAAP